MKGRNRIKSTLLALLLSLSMVITYLPASMIAYANDVSEGGLETEWTDNTGEIVEESEDVKSPDGKAEDGQDEEVDTDALDDEVDDDASNGEKAVEDAAVDSSEQLLGAPAEEANVEEEPTRAVVIADKPEGTSVLTFTSDTHNKSGNVAANRLGDWIDIVQSKYGLIDAMAFGGDMGDASAGSAASFWTLTNADIAELTERNVPGVYTTGNHEYNPGDYGSTGSEAPSNTYKISAQGAEGLNYKIYCLGSESWSSTYSETQISSLRTYLSNAGTGKPIFIITHFPLHYYNSRSTTNADKVIDLLNTAANSGQKIVFLWGHNHTMKDTYYDYIYRPNESIQYDSSGNSKTLKFYYGAAGCMSDTEYGGASGGSASVKGKGLVVTINSENLLSFTYFDANGNNVTEGGTYSEVPASGLTIDEATETGDDGQPVTVGQTVKENKTLQLHVTFEPYGSTGIVSWSSGDESIATVDENGLVKGKSPGTTTITATLNTAKKADISASIEVTVAPRGAGTYYVLASELKSNKDYLIVSAKTEGSAFALTNNGSSSSGTAMGSTAVDIVSGDLDNDGVNELYIDTDDEKLAWTATANESGFNLTNGEGYLEGVAQNVRVFSPQTYPSRYWTYSNEYLEHKGGSYTYEVFYSNGFTYRNYRANSGSPQNKIYIFEETSVGTAPVSGVTLNKSTLELAQGGSEKLIATVAPANAANKNVTWTSSNPQVATVSSTGVVKALTTGNTVITVKTVEGNYTATCNVTVSEQVVVEYVLTETLENGRDYLIANGKSGDVFIVSTEAGSSRQLKGVLVSVTDGKIAIPENVEANTAFTAEIKTSTSGAVSAWLENEGQYLYADSNDGLRMAESSVQTSSNNSGKYWHYKADGKNLLWFFKDTSSSDGYTDTSGTYKYYLKCTDGIFTDAHVDTTSLSNTGTPEIYIYEKKVPVTGITISPTTAAIAVGEETQLTANVAPDNASIKTVTWSSSDTSVATVDANGKVTSLGEGSATITATTDDGGFTADCEVTVNVVAVTGISLDKDIATIEIGKSTQLTATISPENATNKNVTWSSSNTSVATVDEDGLVTAVAEGSATITVTTEDGEKTATCRVTVTQPVVRPGYVIEIDGYALSTEPESDYHPESSANKYYGLKGVKYEGEVAENPPENILWTLTEAEGGYYIKSLDGRYLNATYDDGSPIIGHLNLDDVPDIWVLDGDLEDWIISGSYLKSTNATTSSKELCLAYETVGNAGNVNLFTVRSKSNADSTTITSPDITTAEVRYEETDTLSNGREYIIAVTKDDNSVYAVKNVATGTTATNTGSVSLEVKKDSSNGNAYIITEDTGVPWKYSSSNQYMTNKSLYLNYNNNVPRAYTSGRAISYSDGKLRFARSTSGSYYYLTCNVSNGTFGVGNSGATVRLFEKRATVTYAIKWVGADGAVLETDELAKGDIPKYKGATPVKADDEQYTYNFIGWSPEITAVTGLAVYTAQFEAIPKEVGHTVTFLDEDGETVIGKVTVNDGTEWDEFDKPAAPEKTGYTFSGWLNAPTIVTEDVSVKASYTVNQYTITFVTGGGTEIPEITADYGTAVTAPTDPTREGYTFKGWDKTIPPTMPAENMTITAQWEINEYTITFNTDGGSTVAAATYEYGADVTEPAAPTKTGYTFTGWSPALPEKMPAEDLTVKAQWTENTYTIVYDANGGTGTTAEQAGIRYTEEVNIAANGFTRSGYSFSGWNTAANGSGTDYSAGTKVSGLASDNGATVTLYAQWTTAPYTISYDLAGGALSAGTNNPTAYSITTETFTLNNPTREGYTFAGWTGTGLESATETVTVEKGSTGNRSYTATWTPIRYEITYELNGGTNAEANPATYTVESEAISLADASRTGYTFGGWYETSDFSGSVVTSIAQGSTGNRKLYAKWAVIEYTITYELDGGTNAESNPAKYTIESEAISLADASRTGYTFGGWYETSDFSGSAVTSIAQGSTGNRKLYAKWTVNQYTITFVTGGGTEIPEITADYGTAVTAPTDPTREGYTFKGWDKTIPPTMPAENMTITAQWEINEYTITFNTDGGSTVAAATYEYGADVTEPAAPTKTGYTFTGWSPALPEKMPAEDLTVKAQWTENTYTIVYDANGGTGTTAEQAGIRYTEEVNIAANGFTRSGYSFSGWNTAANGSGTDYSAGTKVSGLASDNGATVTLYAQWTTAPYTISYDLAGGALSAGTNNPTAYSITTETFTLNNPTREGYTFAGWTGTGLESATETVTVEKGSTGNRSYTATWTPIRYEITYELNGGTNAEANPATYTVESEAISLADASRTGYTFGGWYETSDFSGSVVTSIAQGSTGNRKLYAKWAVIEYTITYELDGGTNAESNPAKYTIESEAISLADASRTGYTFGGWYETSDFSGSAVTSIAQGSTGNRKLYAKWTVNQYTITFVDEDGTTVLDTQTLAYGELPVYGGKTPTKGATPQYTYTFDGWTPKIEEVTGEATYTAKYSSTINEYTVIFKNDDGTVLKTLNVAYGETPTYTGTPTKAATAQYTYTFKGWDHEIVAVEGNATYTATYSSEVNEYLITFVNSDGTKLQSNKVAYGATPVFTGTTPMKAADAQYTYTFSGWSPEISTVDGPASYTAEFSSTVNKYTVTWKNYDGTVLETDKNVEYGTVPTYDGKTPTKPDDAQHEYVFANWTPTVSEVKGDVEYTALFTEKTDTYSVTWNNSDGTTLKVDKDVKSGTIPSYSGITPTKQGDAQYTYSFAGWSPEVKAVTDNVIYTATYTKTVNTYTVIFADEDGTTVLDSQTLAYGATPVYGGKAPAKAADSQNTYTFKGWEPAITEVTGNAIYKATYSTAAKDHTISFVNEDGTVLQSSKLAYGETPVYTGTTPAKAADAQYTYTFNGWTPAIKAVTGDATYTATFDKAPSTFTVIWNNYDGKTLKVDKDVAYGTTPKYTGATPTRLADAQNTYTFAGWSPDVAAVTKNVTYTATFKSAARNYGGLLIATMKAVGNTQFTISWTGYNGADGFDIFLAKCNKGKNKYELELVDSVGGGVRSWTVPADLIVSGSNMQPKTAYKAVIKAYIMANGKKEYVKESPDLHAYSSGGDAKYTNAKAVKAGKVTVKVKKTKKIKATATKVFKKKKLIGKGHAPTFRYLSTDPSIATVSAAGKVKGIAKGTCYIYVYTANGVYKMVKVVVK